MGAMSQTQFIDQSENISHIPGEYSVMEWKLRCELAAVYRLLFHYGLTDLIYTHVSLRIPGPERHFLINPYGLMFDEITASSLIKIDVHGNPVEDSPYTVNPAGFIIHSAIHAAREDAHCVLHTHSRFVCAVAAQKQGLLPLNQLSMEFFDRVGYHDYEGVALNHSEQERILRDLGSNSVLFLRNHGLLTVGLHPYQAFTRAYYMEKACQIQIEASASGTELIIPGDDIAAHTAKQLNGEPTGDDFEDDQGLILLWKALERLVQRKYPDYAC